MLYALQHIGFTIPPQADAYWDGEAGPGPSYLDDDPGRETTGPRATPSSRLEHAARGPAPRGRRRHPAPTATGTTNWDLSDPDHPNPEYRA